MGFMQKLHDHSVIVPFFTIDILSCEPLFFSSTRRAMASPLLPYKSHEGSQFHPDLNHATRHVDCLRATDSRQKVCSGFDGTSLEDRLEELAVQTIFVVGLATDACVKQTVLDACRLGFRVVVLENGIRGMNAQPDDSQKAIQERQEPSWQRQPIWDFRCNRPLAHFL